MSDSHILGAVDNRLHGLIPTLSTEMNSLGSDDEDDMLKHTEKPQMVTNDKSVNYDGNKGFNKASTTNLNVLGIPKTSRFQRMADSNTISTPVNTYSPYLYTQHKIRPNAPFDQFQLNPTVIESESPIIEDAILNNIHYTIRKGSIPTVQITGKENLIHDPYEFYRLLEPLGQKYGAILIDFSTCEDSLFNDFELNTENFWFKPRKQHVGSFNRHSMKKLDFHYRLYQYHKIIENSGNGSGLGKVPNIDKRTLDLYRLWTCVRLRGGFKSVCQKKLWAQIGRELGYSGRIMSSLSTSLRSAYLKIFSENDGFDKYCSSVGYDTFLNLIHEESSKSIKTENENTLLSNTESIHSKKHTLAENVSTRDNISSNKRLCKESAKTTEFYASNKEYIRMRDILKSKGFETSYETAFEQKGKLETILDPNLFGFNFGICRSSSEIYDKSMHESKTSPIYNLKQYSEKAQNLYERVKEYYGDEFDIFENSNSWRLHQFEALYNKAVVNGCLPFDIDTAIDLLSSIHGSGFPTIKKSYCYEKPSLNMWNVNNLNNYNESLLKYLDVDYGALGLSKFDIGMLFSTTGWAYEDSALPLLDYLHFGSSKLWYIISPESQQDFELLLKQMQKENSVLAEYTNSFFEDREFKSSDFFQCFNQSNMDHEMSTRGRAANIHPLLNILEYSNADTILPHNIQIPINTLRESKVKFFSVVQNPKTFILKFPMVYTSTISSGFNLSEKSLFAPKEWLKYIMVSTKWTQDRQLIPSIMPFQFLMNIIDNSDNPDLRVQAGNILIPLVKKELHLRSLVPKHIPRKENKFDYISDLDLSCTGASKIVISDDNDCITLSISQFLEKRDYFESKPDLSIELHEYFSTERLGKLLQTQIVSPGTNVSTTLPLEEKKDILEQIKELVLIKYKNRRIPLSELKILALNHKSKHETSFRWLKDFLSDVNLVIRRCRDVLDKSITLTGDEYDFGSGFNINIPTLPEGLLSITELISLKGEVDASIIDFKEVVDIHKLVHMFSKFQKEAQEVLQTDNFERILNIYKKGLSLRVDSKYLDLLRLKLGKVKWIEIYHKLFILKIPPNDIDWEEYTLEKMYNYLCIGADLFGDEKITELHVVSQELTKYKSLLTIFSELIENKKYSYMIKDLEYLKQEINNFIIPIEPRLRKGLNQLLSPILHTKGILSPFLPRLLLDETLITKMEHLLRSDSLDALYLIPRFDGSAEDHRFTQTEAHTYLPIVLYSYHIKKYKTWLQDLNKYIGNTKLNLTTYSEKICHVLDLKSDNFNSTLQNNNDSIYCFCRQADVGGVMVQCEICQEWYHVTCISNGKWKSLPEDESTVFCCQLCLHHSYDLSGKLFSYDTLLKLCIQSFRLTIIPDKQILQLLFRILRACLLFLHECISCLPTSTSGNLTAEASRCKFLLRKMLGSGVNFPNVKTRLALAFAQNDSERINGLIKKNKTIVTTVQSHKNDSVNTPSI